MILLEDFGYFIYVQFEFIYVQIDIYMQSRLN